MPSPKVLFIQAAPCKVANDIAMDEELFFKAYVYDATSSAALDASGASTKETENAPAPCNMNRLV